jgi:hypothetical protein
MIDINALAIFQWRDEKSLYHQYIPRAGQRRSDQLTSRSLFPSVEEPSARHSLKLPAINPLAAAVYILVRSQFI